MKHPAIAWPLSKTSQEKRRVSSRGFCAVQAVNPITQIWYDNAVVTGSLPSEHSEEIIQEQLRSFAERVRQHEGLYVENRPLLAKDSPIEPVLKGFATVAGVAFYTKREKKPMAVLLLGFRKRRRLRKIEKDLLNLFTDQWLPVLENVWLLGRYREVVKIGQEINQTLKEPRDLFEQLFESVSKILDTKYFFMLAVYHQQNKTIDYHMAYQGNIKHSQNQALDMELSEAQRFKSGCAYVIEKKEPLIEVHCSQNLNPKVEFKSLLDPDEPDPESLVFVPLIFRDEPLGVLLFNSFTLKHLTTKTSTF